MRKLQIALAVSLSVLSVAAGAENWPAFRGAGSSGISRTAAPTTWDIAKSTNVQWKTPIPGIGLSSPIVWENRIYVTTAVSQEPFRGNDFRTRHVWKLLALDRATGKVFWEVTAHEGVPYMQRNPESSYANATPVTDGQHIVALFGTDAFACFDKNGKMLWKKTLQLNSDREGFHFGSSPIIVEDLAILQDDRDRDSYIAAYRLRDGGEAWKVPRNDGTAQSTPTVYWTRGTQRHPIIMVSADKSLRALDARTGKQVWLFQSAIKSAGASTTIAGDVLIYASGGNQKPVYALRADSAGDISLASGQSNNAGVIWQSERGGAFIPSPLVLGNQALVLGDNGVLTSYNVASGRQLFQQRAGSGEFYASPVAADGKVYVFNKEGGVTVMRVAPTFEIIARNQMNEGVSATPAIADGTMYVRTAGHLIALRESSAASR